MLHVKLQPKLLIINVVIQRLTSLLARLKPMTLLKSSVLFLFLFLNLNLNYFMYNKKITRSTVNEEQYTAPAFPTSGFPLSYRRYSSFMLGRLHVAGFHWTMPGDKISGKTSGQCTFNRIVTPLVSPVNAMQYNIFLPLRAFDRSFQKGITPTKLNQMSANWSMPMFNTRYLVDQILRAYFGIAYNATITDINSIMQALDWAVTNGPSTTLSDVATHETVTLEQLLYTGSGGSFAWCSIPVTQLTTDGTILCNMADTLYLRDALLDIAENITAKLGTKDNPLSGSMLVSDFINLFFSTLLTPFVGRYSYYGEFKYEFLRPWDFYRLSRSLTGSGFNGYDNFLKNFSDTPQNEYKVRMMYAIWYSLFRNVDLEPVTANLPDFRDWSSTSIFDMANGGNLLYLIYRIRPWEKDCFISSQIDDLSRHVYAPIVQAADTPISYHTADMNNYDTNTPIPEEFINGGTTKPEIYKLGFLDPLSGQVQTISCPVPSNINDVLSSLDTTFYDAYGLDLNTLRQSQMLEKYLKRNYLFGDEYQDRMLAHYNSRVSDLRINKPEILSQSLDGYDMGQEVSNVSTDETKVGQRTATATIDVNGNEFNTFAEEFGLVVSVVCFMPRAMYDGTDALSYMSKQIHLPLPEFASNNEEFGRKLEIAGSGLAPVGHDAADDNRYIFGRYPAYHAWRSRTDEVGGMFLDELQDSTFRRFFGMFSDDTTPKLNYFFIHCRPNLNMFANKVAYDCQLYGDLVNDCYVERVLPVPVEVI